MTPNCTGKVLRLVKCCFMNNQFMRQVNFVVSSFNLIFMFVSYRGCRISTQVTSQCTAGSSQLTVRLITAWWSKSQTLVATQFWSRPKVRWIFLIGDPDDSHQQWEQRFILSSQIFGQPQSIFAKMGSLKKATFTATPSLPMRLLQGSPLSIHSTAQILQVRCQNIALNNNGQPFFVLW